MREELKISSGSPFPLGATFDGKGTNFALFSSSAQKVMLCLFDEKGEETQRIVMPEYTNEVFHVYVYGVMPGQRYGYRVFGEYAPERGLRFNHNKLLIDPYAKALTGPIVFHETMLGYRLGSGDLSFDRRNSAPFMPKCIVVDEEEASWKKPETPWEDTIIYESHLKGFTKLMEQIPAEQRGSFAGMAAPEAVDYLKSLGITALELLPVASFFTSGFLTSKGLTNYWGYDPIAFMAPHEPYLSTGRLEEVKTMVRVLHEANIEVILDVVFNHTGEGNHEGPTLSFRGIDNGVYYRLDKNPRYYYDTTGCGASFNVDHPRVLQLVTDSLRYWSETMGVDGFRFDLAVTNARNEHNEFSWRSNFISSLQQDPVLQKVKLIAEPWDLGPDGYKTGYFPAGWGEWNDKYRDTVRRFLKGDEHEASQFASRIAGSSDLYAKQGRRPWSSVNFITAHDGFTLQDLVSYNEKHNEANLEDNRDGTNSNWSWNGGEEGPTENPELKRQRLKRAQSFMTALLLSKGTPMILSGDEVLHTQRGNNNAYCQDNEISWFPWNALTSESQEMLDFVRKLISLRKKASSFHQGTFFTGKYIGRTLMKDVMWVSPEGREMMSDDWNRAASSCLGLMVNLSEKGSINRHYLLIFNATGEVKRWKIPEIKELSWKVLLQTGGGPETEKIFSAREEIEVPSWSVLIMFSDSEIVDEFYYFKPSSRPERGSCLPVARHATAQELDGMDFMVYGPLGPVSDSEDLDEC